MDPGSGLLFYMRDELPNAEVDATDDMGLAGLLNIEPGFLRVATPDGESAQLLIKPETVTYTQHVASGN